MSSNPFSDSNPYTSPSGIGGLPPRDSSDVQGRVLPPAIALIIVAGLGLTMSLFNVAFAVISGPLPVDPNAPDFVRGMQQSASGPVAIVAQSLFALLNVAILFGGVQMARRRMRPLAITASVLAMVNVGTCCCVIGLPVGVWSLVILFLPEVAAAFRENSGQSLL